jgi:hypothetical protein
MSATTSSIPWRTRLGWNRTSYMLLSFLFVTIVVIGIVWWPMLADYLGTFDPRSPWWIQVDWLLLGVFGVMSVLIMRRADIRRDAQTVAVGLMGGLVIESWGTQTGLWAYYTLERPPLWIIPAWPVASLAIDRLTSLIIPAVSRLDGRRTMYFYIGTFGTFSAVMLAFIWPARGFSLTAAALVLCGFIIATPVQARVAVATFAAGAGLGYFLELWGTTRGCWTYYTLETPPLFAVLAHGMAAVAFWRSQRALRVLASRMATLIRSAEKVRGPGSASSSSGSPLR